jgi:DNA polymerase III delta prime subunit
MATVTADPIEGIYTYQVVRCKYPKRVDDFKGFAICECKYESTIGQTHFTGAGDFSGQFFSLRPYYIYTAYCRPRSGRYGLTFYVNELFRIQKQPLTPVLIKTLVIEVNGGPINDMAMHLINNKLHATGANLSLIRTHMSDVHDMIMTADYFTAINRLTYAQIYTGKSTVPMTERQAYDVLAALRTNPICMLVAVADNWADERPVIGRLVAHANLTGLAADELRLMYGILDRRHYTGDLMVDPLVLSGERVGVTNGSAALDALVTHHWVVRCTNFDRPLFCLPSDEQTCLKICSALMRVASNFHEAAATGQLDQPGTTDDSDDDDDDADEVKPDWSAASGPTASRKLSAEQLSAIDFIRCHPITILQAPPGTGKTTTMGVLVRDVFHSSNCVVEAFVGYQAIRIASVDVIGMGVTCHTAVSGHERAAKGKRPYDVAFGKQLAGARLLIIEEFPNICNRLMLAVLEANITKLGASKDGRSPLVRIVFCGDPKQIPPIGPGQPGSDMADFLHRSTITLTQNHRVKVESRELIDIDKAIMDATSQDEITNKLAMHNLMAIRSPITFKAVDNVHEAVDDLLRRRPLADCLFLAFERADVAYLSRVVKECLAARVGISGSGSSSSSSSSSSMQHNGNATAAAEPIMLKRGVRFMIVERHFRGRSLGRTQYKSADVRNGQFFTVKRLFKVSFVSRNKLTNDWLTKEEEIDVIPLDFQPERGKYVFVDCENGYRICVHPQYVDPACIDPSYAATVNKLQGSESPAVVVYMPDSTAEKSCWTKAHFHVAFTRAQEELLLVGGIPQFARVAARPIRQRPTPLISYLPQIDDALVDANIANASIPALIGQLLL